MAERTFTTKDGDVWIWEETPEVLAALANYWNTVNKNEHETTNN
jgi:ligand-binding SRPBCC domain-containing protein